ncbi:hypothetical protein PMAYCL1PPCAC_15211 [Pristionchus mayeri]|uniref:N-acetyltransferase domain-containing protein n=1 Tax=Pristionchus mayeri TaxID=1317129 RepID=A0AAN5HYC5_9BILA|nr:hypothetical protein PMAYCL1PPCAC_15211 [Pristionchus mayeri]
MQLRAAKKEDLPGIFDLIVGLATFQKKESQVTLTLDDLKKNFDDGFCNGFIIGNEAEKIAGMTLYHFRFSSWNGMSIYVNDLLVRPEYRNMTYGTQLLTAVAKMAKEKSVGLITWHVLDWNTAAIGFYDSVARVSREQDGERYLEYKMTREDVEKLAI